MLNGDKIEALVNCNIKQKSLPYFKLRLCPNCEKNFIMERKDGRKRKYCSDFCKNKQRQKIRHEKCLESLKESRICPTCKKTFFKECIRGMKPKYCSKLCRVKTERKNYAERRNEGVKRLEIEFVTQLGGHCQICGFSESLFALEFHHVKQLSSRKRNRFENPHCKTFDLSKVVLLCANCYRRTHSEFKNDKETQNRLEKLLLEKQIK